jgi:hypothetical protein
VAVMAVKYACGNALLEITGGDPEFRDWGFFKIFIPNLSN